jgi:hypothetical protein
MRISVPGGTDILERKRLVSTPTNTSNGHRTLWITLAVIAIIAVALIALGSGGGAGGGGGY